MIVYILILLTVLLYLGLKYKHAYWTRRKIPQDNPRFLFGSVDRNIIGSGNPTEYVRQAYWDLKKKGLKHGKSVKLPIKMPDKKTDLLKCSATQN